jgi:hypothetical protein
MYSTFYEKGHEVHVYNNVVALLSYFRCRMQIAELESLKQLHTIYITIPYLKKNRMYCDNLVYATPRKNVDIFSWCKNSEG